MGATLRIYDVSAEAVYLASDGHGIDVNPEAPKAPGEGPLRGPFKTLMIVALQVHCSRTGDLQEFPFRLGHPDLLSGDALLDWVRAGLMRVLAHEAAEGLGACP